MTRTNLVASDFAAEEAFTLLTPSGLLMRVERRLSFAPRFRALATRATRIATYLVLTWLAPLFLASLQAPRPGVITFFADFETHLRALVAVPLLLLGEGPIDSEVSYVVHSLASHRRCRDPRAVSARVRSLRRLLDHRVVTALLLVLALLFVPSWIRVHTSGPQSWVFALHGDERVLTAAGTWEAFVSGPTLIFLLLRWVWRWLVLALVFARSAPMLRPVVSHADQCGGFSFASYASAQFAWVIAGASTVVSARWLWLIVREGVPPTAVTRQMVALPILSVLLAFFPLLGFAAHFARAKRSSLRRYRAVVEGHARNVERAWFRRPYPALVCAEEASSLIDLSSVYERVRSMRIIPYRRAHLVVIVIAALAPMLPVASLIAPIDEILRQVFQALL